MVDVIDRIGRLGCGLLALSTLVVGCSGALESKRPTATLVGTPPVPPQPAAGAGGLGFDVENISPQKVRIPGGGDAIFFPVKFVCGKTGNADMLPPAVYGTVINVLNLLRYDPEKMEFRWYLNVRDEAFAEGQEFIGPLRSWVIDCPTILAKLQSHQIDPNGFIEGYVVIEDVALRGNCVTLNVTAAYSVLHKQLHPLPDLIPVRTADGYCRLDADSRLVVTVKNVGERDADMWSITQIDVKGIGIKQLSTPPLAVGEQVDLDPIDVWLPDRGRSEFTIDVDQPNEVLEVDEFNNHVVGVCERVF